MRRVAVLVSALLLWAVGGWFAAAQADPGGRVERTVTITVRTVPALAGARFTLDGQEAVTGADGAVRFSGPHDFDTHTLRVDDSRLAAEGRRFTFARWAGQRDPDQAFRRTVRGLPRRADYTVTAAFTGRFRTTVRCVDERGRTVPAGRIPRVTLRADTGATVRVTVGRPVWLDGLLPVYRKSVLTVRRVRYALVDAAAYGANTVDSGRQRFVPARGAAEVVFTTPFHDLSVSGRDAVFGSHAGRRVRVVLPDGSVREVGFGTDRTAVVRDLPHGRYDIEITGAQGLGARQSVRLSRDQAVRVRVVSRADLLLAGGALLVFAGGLLGVGRLLRHRLRRQES
ncbi:hypothetical protein [Streptomyces sp. VRA16 Mangrove soil]|uniref:hypothetical protein n=1 Tax=Streptomyces sp. VRA16 Mangrove soil TaxID=2817434 RepID=UPI001A9FB965|nr:hypothetical protein [Streptomyces sp. VRA16 Mangrove soil]MBO1330985.1 hypothetical protein [Streptomyces sp. VRA16 Mangrove soil]